MGMKCKAKFTKTGAYVMPGSVGFEGFNQIGQLDSYFSLYNLI